MKLRIERPHVEEMVKEFPRLAGLIDQLRFGNSAEIALSQLANTEISYLRAIYANGDADYRARAAQLSTLQHALGDAGERFEGDDLEPLVPDIDRLSSRHIC